ncbi:hypothetical protein PIB30_034987 [Stylosanthes scabra]|uniref:SHSP domain-containing protein n=1 Tax=Stylosanthes scabra TaxID=79078 RepID=A0ABU6QDB3_9FABA|nr:hypothetical protein [Stylosanthes scabra]
MAMRPRTPTFRTHQSVRRIYETLQPKSEMKETPEAFLLHVYLPGYTKERIKITFVGSSRKVKVSGERPIQGNKWSRFDQSYPVPENCNPEALQAKFEVGTLILTMPKIPQEKTRATTPNNNKDNNKATEDATTTTTEQKEPLLMGHKTGTEEEATSSSSSKRPIESKKPEYESGLKALIPPSDSNNKIPEQIIKKQPPSDEKPSKREKEEDEPKATLTAVAKDSSTEKHEDEGRLKTRLAVMKKQLEEKEQDERLPEKEKEIKEEEYEKKPSEPRKLITNDDVGKGVLKEKEIKTRKMSPKLGTSEVSTQKDMIDIVGNGIRELAASASVVVTRIKEGKWNEEEKDLVVNMAAAVAVIAGLGAYVSYRFVSS